MAGTTRMIICKFSVCAEIEHVKRPGESHEGVGRKKKSTLAGTWEQIRTKILRAFGGMMAGP